MSDKTYVVKFTKLFNNGYLLGLTYDSQISFPSLDLASEYVNFCLKHFEVPVVTVYGSDYTIHCARIT